MGVLVALALWPPAPASAEACDGSACGVPSCWDTTVRVRPDMPRAFALWCEELTSAELVSTDPGLTVTGVAVESSRLAFTARTAPGATGALHATLRLSGPEGSVDVPFAIEVVPLSVNSPPTCHGDRIAQRSDGQAPVDLFMHPSCSDPDEDEFVMDGAGPGTHLDAPKQVPAGHGEANWHYRTATASGNETATVWATDVLGARSETVELEITVGPGVDRLPSCHPNPGSFGGEYLPIRARPGATRRFGVVCEDPDGDPFSAGVGTQPERGAVTLVAPGGLHTGWWGAARWLDGTYVPSGASAEPDPFTVTTDGERGAGPVSRMAIVPVSLPENHGGGCGWSGLETAPGTPGLARITCTDDEGDPLGAEVVAEPLHGSAAPAAVVPALYGAQDIVVPYTPDAGHEGYDCIKVRISDGHGYSTVIQVDIQVRDAPVHIPWPSLPDGLPGLGVPQPPPVGAPLPVVRGYARDVLGTKAVRRAASGVWFARRLSRARLLREGAVPGALVLCPEGCRVRASSRLAGTARAARRRVAADVAAGGAQLLHLALDARQRTRLRRARKPEAAFAARLDPGGAVRRTLPIR